MGDLPYLVTLGPYAFHWFSLTRQETDAPVQGAATGGPVPVLELDGPWDSVFEGAARRHLEALLPNHLAQRRWFPGKDRAIATVRIADVVPLRRGMRRSRRSWYSSTCAFVKASPPPSPCRSPSSGGSGPTPW